MSIPVDLLITYGATYRTLKKKQILFYENDPAIYYFQVVSGKIKMINLGIENEEVIQGIFTDNQSFGEPPLFSSESYPASAVACEPSKIIRLPKDDFFLLLNDFPFMQMNFLQLLSKRLGYKAKKSKLMVTNSTEDKILGIIKLVSSQLSKNHNQSIKLTRQEIADLCGLRVETVIRQLKVMHEKGLIETIEGNIFIK